MSKQTETNLIQMVNPAAGGIRADIVTQPGQDTPQAHTIRRGHNRYLPSGRETRRLAAAAARHSTRGEEKRAARARFQQARQQERNR